MKQSSQLVKAKKDHAIQFRPQTMRWRNKDVEGCHGSQHHENIAF